MKGFVVQRNNNNNLSYGGKGSRKRQLKRSAGRELSIVGHPGPRWLVLDRRGLTLLCR